MGADRLYRYWLLAAILVIILSSTGGLYTAKASGAAAVVDLSQIQQELTDKVFLPCILNNLCLPTFFDDFSLPDNGWQFATTPHATASYISGEYVVEISVPENEYGTPYYGTAVNPQAQAANFKVIVSVQIDQAPTGFYPQYGLIFDRDSSGEKFYSFEIVSNGDWYLWKYDSIANPADPWGPPIASGSSDKINHDTALNRLGVERNGSWVALYVNGNNKLYEAELPSNGVVDGFIGLIAENSNPGVSRKYYFDNFGFFPVTCDWTAIFNGIFTPTIPTQLQTLPALTPSSGWIEKGSRGTGDGG